MIPIGGADACMGPASACTYVTPANPPDFSVSCAPSSLSIEQGSNDTSTCTVRAIAGYSGTVNLSCSGNPAGIGCAFSPGSVNPTAASTLTVSVDQGQATGTYNFDVVGDDGTRTRTSRMRVTVTTDPDLPPIPAFTVSCNIVRKCSFDASASTDDFGIALYKWNFGDGTPEAQSPGPTIEHRYMADGQYTVTLTVVDTGGQPASIQVIVQVKDLLAAFIVILGDN